ELRYPTQLLGPTDLYQDAAFVSVASLRKLNFGLQSSAAVQQSASLL
ncbi:4308_t:CDS:1, partial [Ambispora gerdemannii]